MKKILIISYYYPPNNAIASWRPYSWAKYFSDPETVNAEVHVVCRYWNGSEKEWADQIYPSKDQHTYQLNSSANHTVHYLATHFGLDKVFNFMKKTYLLGPFYFVVNLLGLHHIETDSFFAFRKYIKKTFSRGYFDTVIVTSPPLNVIRLGYSLKKYFPKAFFVADFRDLWNNRILDNRYKPGRKVIFFNKLYVHYIRKWLKRFDLVTSVSKGLTDKIAELGDYKTEIIMNGYECELFNKLRKDVKKTFNITSVGTIYTMQEFNILAEGIIGFARQNNFDPAIQIGFIGTKTANPELCQLLENNLPAEILTISDRIERTAALKIMKNADVLVYPAWAGSKGIYSGKIFEYLATGNNILVAPCDNDVIKHLLDETKTGVSRNAKDEVTLQLQQWYDEWKEKGFVSYQGLQQEIQKYSRESQAKKMANSIYEVSNQQVHS